MIHSYKIKMLNRKEELLSMLKRIERRLRNAPEGTLRISNSTNKKRKQFYHRQKPEDKRGRYIRKNNYRLAEKLAQKDYELKMAASIRSEIMAIDQYLKYLPQIEPEQVYVKLSDCRKQMVIPDFEPDDVFLEQWSKVEYTGKEFSSDAPELFTDKGERVRSKSEVIIANALQKHCIPYRYEYPIMLSGYGTVYPDFTILDLTSRKEIYWEHQGMMDDPEYAEKAIRKISQYTKNGIYQGERLIITSETRYFPINIREINRIIEHYFLHEE